jgi:hypothetical protein
MIADPRVDDLFAAMGGDGSTSDAMGEMFADPFLYADAGGARPVPRDAFLESLPARVRMFADAGVGRTELTAADQQRLDDHYLLVRAEWTAPRLAGGDPVHLASSFVLHDDGSRLQVVAYLNHEGRPANAQAAT